MNFIRVTIAALNKKLLKDLADAFHDRLNLFGKHVNIAMILNDH